ncbi:glycosyltransferase family 4 protein [Maribacter sp. CXY002]|uniref:glycosyltransferase family 4 protein n=1 Tax=Maribacter luteocoastalis TaxID=3407671 RepID=UPI003B6839C7
MDSEKKNIAFLINGLQAGGAERVVVTLANFFVNTYNVNIIKKNSGRSFYEIHPDIKVHTLTNTIQNSTNLISAIYGNFKLIIGIKRICKLQNIDILIGFTTTSSVLAILVAKSLNIPSIISERNNPIVVPPNLFWQFLRNRTYKTADFLVVQTNANKSFFSQYIDNEKIRVILNPISEDIISHKNRPTSNKEKIILNVGRLNNNKAQDVLIKAFANIPNNDWKLILVGDGPKIEEYKKLAFELGVSSNVIFTGNIANVQDYYSRASIFAFTSQSEGLPNALMEAMYYGLPCISTNCPNGPSDLITTNENGILIPVGNHYELSEQLKLLINKPKLRSKLGKNALKTSKAFELEQITNQWNNLILSSLKEN